MTESVFVTASSAARSYSAWSNVNVCVYVANASVTNVSLLIVIESGVHFLYDDGRGPPFLVPDGSARSRRRRHRHLVMRRDRAPRPGRDVSRRQRHPDDRRHHRNPDHPNTTSRHPE